MVKLNELSQIKAFFAVFNGLLMLIGISYLGVGSTLLNNLLTYPWFAKYYREMGAIMVTVGILSIILSFYGLIYTFIRKIEMLYIYLGALILVLVFGVSVGIIGLSYSDQTPNIVSQVVNFNYFNATDNSDNVDKIQNTYGCCGINLPNDWTVFLGRDTSPNSCCITRNESPCNNYFSNGCFKIVQNTLGSDMSVSGGLSLGIALPMIIGIVLVLGLISNEKDKSKDTRPSSHSRKTKYELTNEKDNLGFN